MNVEEHCTQHVPAVPYTTALRLWSADTLALSIWARLMGWQS
jgi:hypothetical protein